jgi:hypothetical protein
MRLLLRKREGRHQGGPATGSNGIDWEKRARKKDEERRNRRSTQINADEEPQTAGGSFFFRRFVLFLPFQGCYLRSSAVPSSFFPHHF